jgi:uncharacterized protein
MATGEVLLCTLILLFPLIDLGLSRFVRGRKLAGYGVTALLLWVVAGLTLMLHAQGWLSVPQLGLQWVSGLWSWIGLALALGVLAYAAVVVRALRADRATAETVAQQMAAYRELMPETRRELQVFVCLVSLSAGFCEELVFRGYLLPLLREQVGVIGAVALSSLMFGLWHVYLGAAHVLRTALMGAVFAGIVLLTGHLWIAIALHALIDIYSGLLHYSARATLARVAVDPG